LKILKSYLRYLAIGLMALFIARAIIIIYEGLSDEIGQAEVGIIPGGKIESNGLVSERLKARLDGGIKIYRLGFVRKLIVSGGREPEGFDEAEVMKTYLTKENIPPDDILADHGGYTTYETAINSTEIMKVHNYKSALIITQFFHVSRARLAFKKAGAPTIYSVHIPDFEYRDFFSILKEVLAYYYYAFRSY
jgi:vancomycin permeability regulator SanA